MAERRTSMRRAFVLWLLVLVAAGCARTEPGAGGGRVSIEELLEDPAASDGARVTVVAGYFGAFEQSVLTSGFRESFPPQPIDPLIWVGSSPPSHCLQRGEHATWAERISATGTFRTGGGFGHLGDYEHELVGAEFSCN